LAPQWFTLVDWQLMASVFSDGRVCISILHPPGDDPFNPQETSNLRWSPIHTVETIVLSVISMLSDPNDESPANIDAAVSSLTCFTHTP
jgi:ubiquitin-conjugating enzyme E2 G1